jgi:hypothetical protein
MKKIAMFFILSANALFGQDLHTEVVKNAYKSFIGQTKDQIEEYWSGIVSNEYFSFLSSGETSKDFIIMEGDMGSPEFSATIENGKCVSQFVNLHKKNISVFETKIQNQGYTYNKAKDAYVNQKLKLKWKVEPNGSSSGLWGATLTKSN